jgi:hypothetical protein
MAFAMLPYHLIDRLFEFLGAVESDMLMRSEDQIADNKILLDTLVHVHPKSTKHDGDQARSPRGHQHQQSESGGEYHRNIPPGTSTEDEVKVVTRKRELPVTRIMCHDDPLGKGFFVFQLLDPKHDPP